MENEKTARDYKETKQNAKEFYTSIGMVWCPALKDRVVFNRLGFQHLIRPKNIERPRREQRKRFALLPIARNIIENDDAITKRHQKVTTHIVKIHGARIPIRSYVNYWEFTERSDGTDY